MDIIKDQRKLAGEKDTDMQRLVKKVILFGWDAADWGIAKPLMDKGQMPYFKALCDAGSSGPIRSMLPMLSPILWTSIATGKTGDQHQILGFTEPDPIAQDGSVRPVRSGSRRVKSLWNILDEAGLSTCVLNWFASYPAEQLEHGKIVTNYFAKPYSHTQEGEAPRVGARGCCWPSRLEESLVDTIITPDKMRRSDILQYIPQIEGMSAEQAKSDPLMIKFNRLYCSMASLQMATTKLAQQEDWDFLAVYQGAIDTFGHEFMDFRAPKLDRIDEEKFERYKDVMDALYREHDRMLGDLIDIAGEDTAIIIVSDHGFHHDEHRPATPSAIDMGDPVSWHKPFGLVAMGGQGIAQNTEPIADASLLDIAPTILRLFGLPAAVDMPGKVLLQTLDIEGDDPLETIWTYEGDDPFEAHIGDAPNEDDPWATEEMVRSLMELGYIEEGKDMATTAVFSRHFCLGQVYASQGRVDEALAEFESAAQCDPEKGKMLDQIRLRTAVQGGKPELVDQLAKDLEDRLPEPIMKAFEGMVAVRQGRIEEGVSLLESVADELAKFSGLNQSIGLILCQAGIHEFAIRYLDMSLETENDLPRTRLALGVCHLGLRHHEQAVVELMHAIQLRQFHPRAHYFLASVLATMNEQELAEQAVDAAIKQWPSYAVAHMLKARICKANGDDAGCERHKVFALEHNSELVGQDFDTSPFGEECTACAGQEDIASLLQPRSASV